MTKRFYVASRITADTAVLTEQEAHHARNVMRKQIGDTLIAFDGSGAEFLASIVAIGRSEIQLEILERRDVCRELPRCLVVGLALPKGDRQRWLVEKVVELGVHRLVPLITERGVAQPARKSIDRLRKAVIEASKQCGRNVLMEVRDAERYTEFVQRAPVDALRLIAQPGARPVKQIAIGGSDVYVAVGPEGGFSSAELASCRRAGWKEASLGRRLLRVETAALALAAYCATQMEP